jgi:WD40 repeat protein
MANGIRRLYLRSIATVARRLHLGSQLRMSGYSRRSCPPESSIIWPGLGHGASVWAVSWSPDSKHIASVGDGRMVQLWNATTGKQVWLLHL